MQKKIKYRNILFMSCFFILFSFITAQAAIPIPPTVRIGLIQNYKNAKKITTPNRTLVLGREVDNQWIAETVFTSSQGYEIQLAPGNVYLISQNYFSTYEEALYYGSILETEPVLTYPMYVGTGLWRIDIGGFSNLQQMQDIQTKLFEYGMVFEQDLEKNNRIFIQGDKGASFFISGTLGIPQFSTGDEKNGITVWDFDGRLYRGQMEFHKLDESGVTPINILPFEHYLYGVVPAESIPSWPMESLKAQAVAARNYALYQLNYANKYAGEPYDLCDTKISQVYRGYSIENSRTTQAVNETQGKLLYYKGELVSTYYFASSGGHTESSENVWSGAVAYLRGVPDIYESQVEVVPWREVRTSKDIQVALEKNGVHIGQVLDVQVSGYTESGRALELHIIGTSGNYSLKKETMRTWLNLKSRKFQLLKGQQSSSSIVYTTGEWGNERKETLIETIYALGGNQTIPTRIGQEQRLVVLSDTNTKTYSLAHGPADGFIFEGQGNGHGVGMSQYGAKGMADHGFTYDQILMHYYQGTELR